MANEYCADISTYDEVSGMVWPFLLCLLRVNQIKSPSIKNSVVALAFDMFTVFCSKCQAHTGVSYIAHIARGHTWPLFDVYQAVLAVLFWVFPYDRLLSSHPNPGVWQENSWEKPVNYSTSGPCWISGSAITIYVCFLGWGRGIELNVFTGQGSSKTSPRPQYRLFIIVNCNFHFSLIDDKRHPRPQEENA